MMGALNGMYGDGNKAGYFVSTIMFPRDQGANIPFFDSHGDGFLIPTYSGHGGVKRVLYSLGIRRRQDQTQASISLQPASSDKKGHSHLDLAIRNATCICIHVSRPGTGATWRAPERPSCPDNTLSYGHSWFQCFNLLYLDSIFFTLTDT